MKTFNKNIVKLFVFGVFPIYFKILYKVVAKNYLIQIKVEKAGQFSVKF
jgi:hypothetical protein